MNLIDLYLKSITIREIVTSENYAISNCLTVIVRTNSLNHSIKIDRFKFNHIATYKDNIIQCLSRIIYDDEKKNNKYCTIKITPFEIRNLLTNKILDLEQQERFSLVYQRPSLFNIV